MAGLAVAVLAFVATQPGSPWADVHTAGKSIKAVYIDDLSVSATGGDKDVVLNFATSPVKRNDGSLATNTQMAMTVTKPDASTFTFKQRTDQDGRIRGDVYGSLLDQVGTYGLEVKVDGTSVSDSANFVIKERAKLAENSQVFTGNEQVFRNAADSANAFRIQNAAGDEIFGVDTLADQVRVAELDSAGTVAASDFSSGNAGITIGGDTNLYRSAANTLATDDAFRVTNDHSLQVERNTSQYLFLNPNVGTAGTIGQQSAEGNKKTLNFYETHDETGTPAGSLGFRWYIGGQSAPSEKLSLDENGLLNIATAGSTGGLTIATDTNLYRSAANVLKTDDTFDAAAYRLGGTNINTAGTLSNVAYKNAFNVFTNSQQVSNGATTGQPLFWGAATSGTEYLGLYFNETATGSVPADTWQFRAGDTTRDIAFTRYDSSIGLYLQTGSGGNVGIGDTSPSTKLALAGTGSANGITLGDDAASPVNLYRLGNDVLATDDGLYSFGYMQSSRGTSGVTEIGARGPSGESGIIFGDLSDTNLYRSAANTLKTDDSLVVGSAPALSVDAGTQTTTLKAGTDAATNGSELITTTDFTNGAWTSTGWTTAPTTATHNAGNNNSLYSSQFTATDSATYKIQYTISGSPAAGSTLSVVFGGTAGAGGCTVASYTFDGTSNSNLTENALVTCTGTSGEISFNPDSTFNGIISAVSIKEVTLNSAPAFVIKNVAGNNNLELRADDATDNLFVGNNSGRASTGGFANVALGSAALQNNQGGIANTALGVGALSKNVGGLFNTAIGANALANNTRVGGNTAVGYTALQKNLNNNNTAVGLGALKETTLGKDNTALGINALDTNTTGTQNTVVGASADVASANLTNATAIGYNSSVSASNTVSLGSGACVAINLTACNTAAHASEKLGVSGDIIASGAITGSSTPDISETIPAAKDVKPFDVVSAGPDGKVDAVRSQKPYDTAVLGVISDGTSTFKINSNAHDEAAPDTGKYLVLAGRVPVNVTKENGPIKPGDYLTTSSTTGYAMKATRPGPTIGKALEAFDGDRGKVMIQTNLSYSNPSGEVDGKAFKRVKEQTADNDGLLDKLTGTVQEFKRDIAGRVDNLRKDFDGLAKQVQDLTGRVDGLEKQSDERYRDLNGKIDQLAGQPAGTSTPAVEHQIESLRKEAVGADEHRDARSDARFDEMERRLTDLAALLRSTEVAGARNARGGSFLSQLGLYPADATSDIAGTVEGGTGKVLRGDGFAVERLARGTHRITFTAPHPDMISPVVTAKDPEDVVVCSVHDISASGFLVKCRNYQGRYVDQDFTFQAGATRRD